MASESTSIRGKDWVFNAFWAACLAPAGISTRCSLNIPVTALFKDGLPVKVVATDPAKGFIEKVPIDDEIDFFGTLQTDNTASDEFGSYYSGFRGNSLKCLRCLRKLLVDFSRKYGYDVYQRRSNANNDILICKVEVSYSPGIFFCW